MAESLAQLYDITKAFEESYDEAGAGRSSEAEFAPVLAAAVDPLVEMCERSADSLKPDAPSRCTCSGITPCVPICHFHDILADACCRALSLRAPTPRPTGSDAAWQAARL